MQRTEIISGIGAFLAGLLVALYVILVDGSAAAFYGSLLAMGVVYFALLYWLERRAGRIQRH